MLTFRQLETFREVMRSRTTQAAAEALRVSQPAVSNEVRDHFAPGIPREVGTGFAQPNSLNPGLAQSKFISREPVEIDFASRLARLRTGVKYQSHELLPRAAVSRLA